MVSVQSAHIVVVNVKLGDNGRARGGTAILQVAVRMSLAKNETSEN